MITSLYRNYCLNRIKEKQFRTLPSQPHSLTDFSSNDFLGLSSHPKVISMAHEYAIKYGAGATGSRLLSGNKACFGELEERIARDKQCESSLVFCSGYQANSTVLAALLDSKVLKNQAIIFFDKLNHASLYHGAILSNAHLVRYKHLDITDLKKYLDSYRQDPRPKFIVSETLFSMDGDVANVQALIDFAKEYGAFLYLDEAFATGIFGKNGYGFSTLYDFQGVDHLIMGTFSKAIGVSGAYVACSQTIKDYLINKCGGFIYSTGFSPMVVGAVLAGWQLVSQMEEQRNTLLQNAKNLREKLQDLGFDTGNSTTHIIPVILGSEEKTLQEQERLLNRGIAVSAARPPTVPFGTSRLRITLRTGHTKEDMDILLQALC